MIKKIFLITDYKGFFGSKQRATFYRGGMDVERIISFLKDSGFDAKSISFTHIEWKKLKEDNPLVLYTSSEDKHSLYKSFIEDIIFHLEQQNISVLPKFEYLKAHNNKVAMELLRARINDESVNTVNSKVFGTLEELMDYLPGIHYPVVIKTYSGAMSRGVALAKTDKQLIRLATKLSKSGDIFHDIKEYLRIIKYGKRYKKESFHRNKFLIQNYIPHLQNDWKVLVFGQKCFVLYRRNRKNDFRASGSGFFEFRKNLPTGLLDYALNTRELFEVPFISLDIGFDGEIFHLLEFQFLYFGTTTLEKAPFYFEYISGKWEIIEQKCDLEKVYVESIVDFIEDEKIL